MASNYGDNYIGVDLRLTNGDLGYTNRGDLALIGDIEPINNIWQATIIRLTTTLGTYLFANNYGTQAKQFVDEPITDSLKQRLKTEINKTILQDPRIKAMVNLTIDLSIPSVIQVSFGIISITGASKYGTATINGSAPA